MTRLEAILIVGQDVVEAVEKVGCEPTNRCGYNGACQGDAYTEWSASIAVKHEDYNRIYVYYYTTNEEDELLSKDVEISWIPAHYSFA